MIRARRDNGFKIVTLNVTGLPPLYNDCSQNGEVYLRKKERKKERVKKKKKKKERKKGRKKGGRRRGHNLYQYVAHISQRI